jgi:hypothetical protein
MDPELAAVQGIERLSFVREEQRGMQPCVVGPGNIRYPRAIWEMYRLGQVIAESSIWLGFRQGEPALVDTQTGIFFLSSTKTGSSPAAVWITADAQLLLIAGFSANAGSAGSVGIIINVADHGNARS